MSQGRRKDERKFNRLLRGTYLMQNRKYTRSEAVVGLQINKRVNIEPILSWVAAMVYSKFHFSLASLVLMLNCLKTMHYQHQAEQ